MRTGVWLESLKERELLENPRPVGGTIKLDLKEAGWEVVDWINRNRDKEGKAFSGSINAASFLITPRFSQKGLCSMVLDGTEESGLLL